MSAGKRKGRLRRPTPGSFAAALPALAAVLALLLLGGCSRLLSIVDPSAF